MTLPDLPSGWKWSTVEDVGRLQLGRQRSPQYHHGSNMKPYLRVANVFEDRIDTTDVMEMHFEPEEFERFRLLPGDVLLNEGQSPEFLGRPAMYRGEPQDCAFTNSLIRFQAGPAVLPEWALLVFRAHLRSGRFTQESRITTNIAHLSLGRLKTVEFPLPPIEEQRRRLLAVEPFLACASAMEVSEELITARIRATADEALRRSFSELRAPVTTLGQVAAWSSGGTPSSKVPEYYGGDIPWVVSGDLPDGPLDDVTGRLTDAGLASSSARWVEPGTVLVAMYGATIGRLAITQRRVTTNQAVAAARVSECLSSEYLFWFLRSQRGLLRKAGQGAAQPNISQTVLKAWPIPVPEPAAQEALVRRAVELHEATQRLLRDSRRLRPRAQALRTSTLRHFVTVEDGIPG